VFNVVQGLGEEAGAPLAAHPDLARICFTGSVATGRLVAAAAGSEILTEEVFGPCSRCRLVAGMVWGNCFFVRDLRAPFGGARQSGIGREGGPRSFNFYSDVKNTVYAPEGWHLNG
jgi:acyl-CoA reductase-like NAD-dependent aldehyde dehydrogenase